MKSVGAYGASNDWVPRITFLNRKSPTILREVIPCHDKVLENINAKLDEFSSTLKNQLSSNKMIETQLAQIAATIPSYEKDRIPSKPEGTMETANLVKARYDFSENGWGFPIKKGDPRNPIITCSIGPPYFS